jgi:hypothetical protein
MQILNASRSQLEAKFGRKTVSSHILELQERGTPMKLDSGGSWCLGSAVRSQWRRRYYRGQDGARFNGRYGLRTGHYRLLKAAPAQWRGAMLLVRDRNQPAQTCEEDLRRDPGDSFLLFCSRSTSTGGNSSAGSTTSPTCAPYERNHRT